MRPVKRKEIIKKTSDIVKISEELIDEVVSHYYHTLQRTMSSMDHMNVYVQGLGVFSVKKKRLNNKILGHRKKMQDISEDMTMGRYQIHMKRKMNLEKMEIMMENFEKEEKIKQEYKNLRKDESL